MKKKVWLFEHIVLPLLPTYTGIDVADGIKTTMLFKRWRGVMYIVHIDTETIDV